MAKVYTFSVDVYSRDDKYNPTTLVQHICDNFRILRATARNSSDFPGTSNTRVYDANYFTDKMVDSFYGNDLLIFSGGTEEMINVALSMMNTPFIPVRYTIPAELASAAYMVVLTSPNGARASLTISAGSTTRINRFYDKNGTYLGGFRGSIFGKGSVAIFSPIFDTNGTSVSRYAVANPYMWSQYDQGVFGPLSFWEGLPDGGKRTQTITVKWPRIGDRKILVDTFDITVSPAEEEEEGDSSHSSGTF